MSTKDKMLPSPIIQEIKNNWIDYCNRLKIPAIEMNYCKETFEQLHMHYSKQSRAYHNWSHIIRCFNEFKNIKECLNSPDEVEMALWFHDVIYEPEKDNNEEKSAKWASLFSKKVGMSDIFAKRVHRLILTTKHDKIPDEMDAKYVIDIDLSIFGQLGDVFLQYEEGIRKEYSTVDDEYYKQRRAQLLQDFLKRDFIYLTDPFQEKYEETARKNLKYSIERLKT